MAKETFAQDDVRHVHERRREEDEVEGHGDRAVLVEERHERRGLVVSKSGILELSGGLHKLRYLQFVSFDISSLVMVVFMAAMTRFRSKITVMIW